MAKEKVEKLTRDEKVWLLDVRRECGDEAFLYNFKTCLEDCGQKNPMVYEAIEALETYQSLVRRLAEELYKEIK